MLNNLTITISFNMQCVFINLLRKSIVLCTKVSSKCIIYLPIITAVLQKLNTLFSDAYCVGVLPFNFFHPMLFIHFSN